MSTFKDLVGLNYGIYDPTADDAGTMNSDGIEGNYIGYNLTGAIGYIEVLTSNPNITGPVRHQPHSTMVLLNLHRNGSYGYPTWKQIRSADNPLMRRQRKSNIFTYVEEHGGRFGQFQSFTEPVVTDSYKPVSLIGDVKIYNENLNVFQNRSVELKTSFGNETAFFANSEINDYFETIAETDDNYEQLRDLYLDGGLEDEGSPIDSFNMFVYRQSIYPKQQHAYLDATRSRKFYVNTFWRSDRADRAEENVANGYGATVPSQSMWPMDDRLDFETRTIATGAVISALIFGDVEQYDFDIGGHSYDNSSGGPGVLQNRYSAFAKEGFYNSIGGDGKPYWFFEEGPSKLIEISNFLTGAAFYSRLHTLKNIYSAVNPSGPKLSNYEFTGSLDPARALASQWPSMTTGSIFNGTANWDAATQAKKEPFYDSYEKFSEDIRVVGKSFSKVPEFRISSHVETYLTKGVVESLPSIFELSGALSQNTTSEDDNFYSILSNSDFLKHFDLVDKDHKDLVNGKIVTLKCKGLKKFLPYEGFYPAQRTNQISSQFYSSYSSSVNASVDSGFYKNIQNAEQFAFQPLMTPIAAPGVLFNSIKSGIAVDFPLIFREDLKEPDSLGFGTFVKMDDLGRTTDGVNDYPNGGHLNNCLIGHTKRTFVSGSTYPLGTGEDHEFLFRSIYSTRIPFEALVEPENYLANWSLTTQEPHPFGLSEMDFKCRWDGRGDSLFKKMSSNFLAEVPEFFIQNKNFKTISSLEEQNPQFGNAISGNYYVMRVKMSKSRDKPNHHLSGFNEYEVTPPQDVATLGVNVSGSESSFQINYDNSVRETITMYSRPSAFGPPVAGDGSNNPDQIMNRWNGSSWGYNFAYTPPYYHGDAWCDLVFRPTVTRKYSVDEILEQVKEYPYYTRYWDPSTHDALRDLTGYSSAATLERDKGSGITAATTPFVNDERNKYYNYSESPWKELITDSNSSTFATVVSTHRTHYAGSEIYSHMSSSQLSYEDLYKMWAVNEIVTSKSSSAAASMFMTNGPQSPMFVNYNAMQLDSSLNIFGKGTIKTRDSDGDGTSDKIEVASSQTVSGKTRWIIQPKFESPILNFNKYNDLSDSQLSCSSPQFAHSQVPRGMWHQYGDLPSKEEGIYLQVEDIPGQWWEGALGVEYNYPKIKSLADLVGFSKDPVRLGEVADVKQISEAVVAVPFIEKDGTRQFFSIPREDIDSCIGAVKREVEEGTFVAGGPPKAGDSVYQMVKKMQKYVFPPSMDFVRYKEIDPFAMYVFEFKHNLTKKDLSDIWQNLPPDIGTRMEEAEATISHELLAHELLGGGAVVKNGVLDDNAEGNGIPSNIQWMIFKAKKRAKTNYFDKVVAKKGTTKDTSSEQLENAQGQTGDDLGITYNWPYDFFSLVELVKIDAEVTFANIENDDKGQKTIKKVEKKSPVERQKVRDAIKNINIARGKGKSKK